MTDDEPRETTDESRDEWPKQWGDIYDPPDRDLAVAHAPQFFDMGAMRTHGGTVYAHADAGDADVDPRDRDAWLPLGVYVDRLAADALAERTIDPGELVERAIEREMNRHDSGVESNQGRRP